MVLWIAMAALAAAACLPLLAALYRARGARDSTPPDVAIYRDQLGEIDRDLARGVMAESEAAAARTEIARRLIRADSESDVKPASPERSRKIAAALIVAVPVAAAALYLLIGSPAYQGQPLASRPVAPTTQDIGTLVAAVEAHLAAAPDDGKGWEVIAPVYVRLGRHDDAVRAYSNTIRILGSTAAREADLGEAMVRASGGTVTAVARAAFERAHGLAPDEPRPRFYLALALQQDGPAGEAIAAWQALLEDAPAGAPWVPIARDQLAALEGAAPVPGPSAEDVEAAAEMSPEDRNAMIEGMVASLAARLADEPDDADGWARLIRSYMVLGRPDDARAAMVQARAVFADDPAGRAVVDAAAREAGLTE